MKTGNRHEAPGNRRKPRLLPLVLWVILGPLGGTVEAQQANKGARIGWLSAAFSATEFPEQQVLDALRSSEWAKKNNLVIEFRHAAGNPERLAQMAAELAALHVDAIVTFSAGVMPAKRATTTIPILMQTSQDPVRSGLVASLARPGGNLTGVTFLTDELSGKRLELLKEAVPRLSRAAIIWEPAHVDNELKGMQAAAPGLGLRLQSIEIPRPARSDEVGRALQTAADAEAVILAPGGFTIANRRRLAEQAAKQRRPLISAWKVFAEDGALLTYGPDIHAITQRLAIMLGKVLDGAKPAELPIEQPVKFELVINLKAANQIGLSISPGILARAGKVIR